MYNSHILEITIPYGWFLCFFDRWYWRSNEKNAAKLLKLWDFYYFLLHWKTLLVLLAYSIIAFALNFQSPAFQVYHNCNGKMHLLKILLNYAKISCKKFHFGSAPLLQITFQKQLTLLLLLKYISKQVCCDADLLTPSEEVMQIYDSISKCITQRCHVSCWLNSGIFIRIVLGN